MLSKLVKAFCSPRSRRINHQAVQAFYAMDAEVAEHPFFWCWYIDHHIEQLVVAGIIHDQLLLPLEVTDYRSWPHDNDIAVLLTRLRMHNKTIDFRQSASEKDIDTVVFNYQHYGTLEVMVQRRKQLDGKARVVAKGLKVLDAEDLQHTDSNRAICTQEYGAEDDDYGHEPVMTICKHTYGHECILKWLSAHKTCLMCRRKLI